MLPQAIQNLDYAHQTTIDTYLGGKEGRREEEEKGTEMKSGVNGTHYPMHACAGGAKQCLHVCVSVCLLAKEY